MRLAGVSAVPGVVGDCRNSGTGSRTVAALKLAALKLAALKSLRSCARERAVGYAKFCNTVAVRVKSDAGATAELPRQPRAALSCNRAARFDWQASGAPVRHRRDLRQGIRRAERPALFPGHACARDAASRPLPVGRGGAHADDDRQSGDDRQRPRPHRQPLPGRARAAHRHHARHRHHDRHRGPSGTRLRGRHAGRQDHRADRRHGPLQVRQARTDCSIWAARWRWCRRSRRASTSP